jgi:hypothetical protein
MSDGKMRGRRKKEKDGVRAYILIETFIYI